MIDAMTAIRNAKTPEQAVLTSCELRIVNSELRAIVAVGGRECERRIKRVVRRTTRGDEAVPGSELVEVDGERVPLCEVEVVRSWAARA